MPLSLLNHSALALFAQRTRIPTSARSIGFCAIWVCISSSSSLEVHTGHATKVYILAAQTAVAAALPRLQIHDKLESGRYPPLAMTAYKHFSPCQCAIV